MLRERPADVRLLAERLLSAAMAAHGRRVKAIEPAALDFLAADDWPGNVRELENEIVRLVMLAADDWLRAVDLSPRILRAVPRDAVANPLMDAILAADGSPRDRVEQLEARILRETMTRCRWNKSRAAEELGLRRVGCGQARAPRARGVGEARGTRSRRGRGGPRGRSRRVDRRGSRAPSGRSRRGDAASMTGAVAVSGVEAEGEFVLHRRPVGSRRGRGRGGARSRRLRDEPDRPGRGGRDG